MLNIDTLIVEFERALLQVNRIKAAEFFQKCYGENNDVSALETMVSESLEKIGVGWEDGSISLSQVYMSGIICEELMEEYLPKLINTRENTCKIAIAVLQDYHALGKRMVCSVLRSGGFEVLDFGQGLSVDQIVKKTVEEKIEILLISTLMLPAALKVKEVREKLTTDGFHTKIIVGGAPFRLDRDLWKRVGADADGKKASDIIGIIERVVREQNE